MFDRLPVAIRYAPSWWSRAYDDKRSAAVTAAFQEFEGCDVYAHAWGVLVCTSVKAGQGRASEEVLAMQARLRVAVEYACIDISDNVIDAAA